MLDCFRQHIRLQSNDPDVDAHSKRLIEWLQARPKPIRCIGDEIYRACAIVRCQRHDIPIAGVVEVRPIQVQLSHCVLKGCFHLFLNDLDLVRWPRRVFHEVDDQDSRWQVFLG